MRADAECQAPMPTEMKRGCLVQWTADVYVIELILATERVGPPSSSRQLSQSLDNPEVSSLEGRVAKRLCVSPVLSWHTASQGISMKRSRAEQNGAEGSAASVYDTAQGLDVPDCRWT